MDLFLRRPNDLALFGRRRMVNADLPEFVLNDGESLPVGPIVEDVVEQGRLARAEEAREDRHGNLLASSVGGGHFGSRRTERATLEGSHCRSLDALERQLPAEQH